MTLRHTPDGTNTQRVEATWKPAKDWFRSRHVPTDNFADALCDYLDFREVILEGEDAAEGNEANKLLVSKLKK
nr:unnamed protein product [Callosobruchus analis]